MRALGRAPRRLAGGAVIALALTAAAAVVAPAAAPGHGPGGVDNPAPAFPGSVTLPAGAPVPGVGGAARPGPGGALLGVIGYRPAVLARLDPRTLRPLPGPRVRLRYGISGYGWSPDRSLLVLGDVDDDALHVVDPVRLRRVATIKFGIVAEAPRTFAWLGPRRLAVVAGDSGDGSTLLMVDPVAGRVLSRRPLPPAGLSVAAAGDRLILLGARSSASGRCGCWSSTD